jgi:hypothetical protein
MLKVKVWNWVPVAEVGKAAHRWDVSSGFLPWTGSFGFSLLLEVVATIILLDRASAMQAS